MQYYRTLAFIFALIFVMPSLSAQYKGSYKVANKLHQSIEERTDKEYDIHVLLGDQVDLDYWEKYFETNKTPYNERAKILIKKLKEKATSTQGVFFENWAKAGHTEDNIKKHWIVNGFSLKASATTIKELAAMEAVSWIGENVVLSQTTYSVEKLEVMAPNGTERGLLAINAPAMWSLGYTGFGTTVFTADTGVDPTHPSLAYHYKGNYVPESEAWYPNTFTPQNLDRGPFDCSNHGTHVTGTVLGLDRKTNDTIGVAFNASWIGGAILCGVGTADNIGAFEWAIDPDGDDDTTDDIPDVINNSWYDPSLNELDCYSVYVPVLQTLEVIGVAVVFSAGNEGPDPGTITQPHNININEVNAFTIGALNGNSSALPIADFSSRGPSHCEGEGSIKIKPEVSAPGVQVRSCVPGNEFALLNGTSMAAPHVSGAILLLKEAFPYLGGKDFKLALYNTARDLGAPGEDNIFGMGIIDVFAAYEYLVNAGNVPANPYKLRDVMLLEAKTSFYACENNVEPYILVENNGIDTVTSFLVEYGGPLETKSFTWTGVMAPKERKYIALEAFTPVSDFEMITVSIVSVNEGADERPFNNSISAPIVLSERKKVLANIEESDKICTNSQIVLTSPLGLSGNFTTNWYDDIFDGNLLYNGNRWLLPADESNKTIYAEITYTQNFGENAPEENPVPESSLESGLVFDAEFGVTLLSFDIYSAQRHTVDVAVLNENNNVVHVISRPQTPEGKRTINVQWYIPPGKNYKLVKKSGKDLYGNKNQINFPYTIEDVLSVKSGYKNGQEANEYIGFYNIKIRHTEPCGRIPYNFTLSQNDSITSEVMFSISGDTVTLPNLLEASSLTENVSFVSWDMGDGTVYADSVVAHEYQSEGTYTICYHIKDQNLCSTASLKDVVVLRSVSTEELIPEDSDEIIIYPNPVLDKLFIEKLSNNRNENISVFIYDQNGSHIFVGDWNKGNTWQTDISAWPGGIYYVRLLGQNQVQSHRFVKF